MADNREVVQKLLLEYGAAMRGDWSDIDGRAVLSDMEMLSRWLHPGHAEVTLRYGRDELGMCPEGKRQWQYWCGNDCAPDS